MIEVSGGRTIERWLSPVPCDPVQIDLDHSSSSLRPLPERVQHRLTLPHLDQMSRQSNQGGSPRGRSIILWPTPLPHERSAIDVELDLAQSAIVNSADERLLVLHACVYHQQGTHDGLDARYEASTYSSRSGRIVIFPEM